MKNLLRVSFVFLMSIGLATVYGQTTRNVDNFTKVSASTNVSVKLIKADEQKVEFKMTGGDEKSLITKVKNGKLIIKIKSGLMNWSSKAKAKVKVYYTELSEVSASAGATVKSDELIYTTDMTVDVSSGAVADLEVEAKKISADVSSGGRILLEGSADNGNFDVSSGANLDASDMICDNVTADASSGGSLKVHANKKLNADASSGGSIRYKGDVEYSNTDAGWSGEISRM